MRTGSPDWHVSVFDFCCVILLCPEILSIKNLLVEFMNHVRPVTSTASD